MANLRTIASLCLLCLFGQMLGIELAADATYRGSSPLLGVMILCFSSLVLLVCTSVYAARKGYHPLVGAIATLPLLGLLVLVLLPNLTRRQPGPRGFEVIRSNPTHRESPPRPLQ